jgi:hypothetical protein
MDFDVAILKTISVPGVALLLFGAFVRWWRKHQLCVQLKPGRFEVTWRPDPSATSLPSGPPRLQ